VGVAYAYQLFSPAVASGRWVHVSASHARRGDVAIWGQSSGMPDGHVAILLATPTTSEVYVFHQNWNQPVGQSHAVKQTISTSGITWYIRPVEFPG
jgi:hypothetical protein